MGSKLVELLMVAIHPHKSAYLPPYMNITTKKERDKEGSTFCIHIEHVGDSWTIQIGNNGVLALDKQYEFVFKELEPWNWYELFRDVTHTLKNMGYDDNVLETDGWVWTQITEDALKERCDILNEIVTYCIPLIY